MINVFTWSRKILTHNVKDDLGIGLRARYLLVPKIVHCIILPDCFPDCFPDILVEFELKKSIRYSNFSRTGKKH